MGKIKKLILEATSPKKVESLLSICLLRMAEFLNTSNIHATIDNSGYFINGTFYTNKDMVQEFINNFDDKKSAPEKVAKPKIEAKGKRGRPKKSA